MHGSRQTLCRFEYVKRKKKQIVPAWNIPMPLPLCESSEFRSLPFAHTTHTHTLSRNSSERAADGGEKLPYWNEAELWIYAWLRAVQCRHYTPRNYIQHKPYITRRKYINWNGIKLYCIHEMFPMCWWCLNCIAAQIRSEAGTEAKLKLNGPERTEEEGR